MNKRPNPLSTLGFSLLVAAMSVISTVPLSFSQDAVVPLVADTTKTRTIPLEKIPLASGEAVIKAIRTAQSLISDEQIGVLKAKNDHLMESIDSSFARQKTIDLASLNSRYLKNIRNYWVDYKIQLQKAKDNLSGRIKTINDKQQSLSDHLTLWKNTKAAIEPKDLGSTVSNIIDGVMVKIDSVNKLISYKTIQMIQILNDASLRGIEIEDVLNQINTIIKDRQTNVLAKTDPALWQIKFTDRANWQLREHFRFFNDNELVLMKRYIKRNEAIFIYYLVYLVLLVFLFRYFNKMLNRMTKKISSPYQFAVKKILSKPVSAALILGLFSSIMFFSNRPLIFFDLLSLLVCIPLIIIVSTIGTNIRYKYVYLFGFIIVLRVINYIFPPDFLLHRLILLVMGACEIVFFLGLMAYIREQSIQNQLLRSFVNLLLILHIGMAIFGIAGNIFGSVMMADQAINVLVTDTFIGFIIFVCAVIVIGLIHFALDSKYMKKLNFIRNYNSLLKIRVAGWVLFISAVIWFGSILRVVGIDEIVNDYFDKVLNTNYKLGSGTFTIGSIFLFFLVIWISVVVSKIVRVILEEDILERLPMKKGVPRMISVMTRYAIVVIGVFIAVSLAGMSLSNLTIILGAFSVGIGFGLQNIFNNLVSGLILLVERPIQIGDVVEVGTLVGHVKSMGIRSSNLHTFDGAEVIVPNGHLISNEVINWTLSDKKRRIEIIPGVAYGSDVHKVHDLFKKILDNHPEIIKNPAPQVYFYELGESALNFRLLFWTDNFDDWVRIRSEIIFKIYDTLKEEGIEIPFPQRDLHIKTISGNINLKTKS